MAGADDISADRLELYHALTRRNRIVGILRWLVPAIGVLVLAVLLVQMVFANITREFNIGRISIERNKLKVETPSYSGRMDDGSTYEISAAAAETGIGTMTLIDLSDTLVVVNRVDGTQTTATSPAAQIDSEKQMVAVEGVTEISDTKGTLGEVAGLNVDFLGQKLSADAVKMTFAGGETLESEDMTYDAAAKLWTFTNATLTLNGVPGGEQE